jgi:hypothetical protein
LWMFLCWQTFQCNRDGEAVSSLLPMNRFGYDFKGWTHSEGPRQRGSINSRPRLLFLACWEWRDNSAISGRKVRAPGYNFLHPR